MTSPLRRVAAGLGLLIIAALPAAMARADGPHTRVTVLSRTDDTARLLFSATGLPSGTALDGHNVKVLVDGVPAQTTATGSGASPARHGVRRAVLVVDTSGSMYGAGINGARAAALAFLDAVPADVQVGLVAFSDRPHLLVPPTTARTPARAAVGRLQAAGETSLYDGVSLALRVLGSSGEGALVVLSDGADTRSRVSLSTATEQLRASGVRMDAVAFNTGDTVRRVLTQLTAASGGKVTAAGNAPQLAAAFSSAAQKFAAQLVLDVVLPASAHGRTVRVEATVAAGAVSLHATTSLDASPVAVPLERSSRTPRPQRSVPGLPLLAVFVGLAGCAYAALVAFDGQTSAARTKKLLNRYSLARAVPPQPEPDEDVSRVGNSAIVRKALALAERVADKPGRREKLVLRLGRANVALKPNEWLVVQFLIGFAGILTGTVLFGALGSGIVTGVTSYLCTNAWLSYKGRRRLRAFDEHLPNSLQLVAGSLSAGFSLAQALDGVVREGLEPMSQELHRALAEARLGVPLEDALDGIAARMDSVDFRWVVMAIRIQREVGGNLAEVLLNTALMMRERARLRRQVKALSAEGRLSAYVLIAIPLLMTVYLLAFRRAYIRTLYTDPIGIGFMISGVVLVCVGALWMRKIVTVEV